MPPRRLLLSVLATASLSAAMFLVLPSCTGDFEVGGDCPPGTSERCCPCPLPEFCPDPDFPGYVKPRPIPWDCANACDGPPPLPPRCTDGGDTDGGDEGGTSLLCPPGTCAPQNPQSWEGPVALYYGPDFEAPSCPDTAPTLVFEGWPEPDPIPCETCSCEPSVGTCSLPTTWTVNSAACSGGGVNTPFNAPTNWDGTCTANIAIQEGKTCGGVPCVGSLTISPPVIEEPPCTPHGNGDPLPGPAHFTAGDAFRPFGRACTGAPWPACGQQQDKACVPKPPSFETCIMREGDEPCPEGWPIKHLLYGEVNDQRQCSACTCSAPSGGSCTAFAAVHGDATCSTLQGSLVVTTGQEPKCLDLTIGAGLAAKSATLLTYEPSTCTPEGGQAVGDLVLLDARTFCCLDVPAN